MFFKGSFNFQEAELEMDEEDMDVIRNMDRETEEMDQEFEESFTQQKINAKYVTKYFLIHCGSDK